ncbi:MAG: hypothetical protein WD851_13250 [Pirellulales bacterium]
MSAEHRRGTSSVLGLVTCYLAIVTAPVTLPAQTGYFGTAKVSITPALPIRLSGYAGRSTESTSVEQDIYATAAVFGSDVDTAILIAVDCTGMPDNVADVVSASLSQQLGIVRERINITSTHTHNGPCIDGYAENLFGAPLPADQQQRVEEYTELLTDRLKAVALDAIGNGLPGHTITWGQGSVGFGVNRRGAGIVDHDLPVIRVADSLGNTKAIITSYASHAVTLSNNSVSGDWPGYAREAIEALYPGATALVMIGAAADINPSPMGSTAAAQNHGHSIANEVARLVSNNLLTPVGEMIGAAHGEIALPYASALEPGDPGNARLAPAGTTDHEYGISTWTFGDEIAMVFLEGEVVVDYSLRLKSQYDDDRMWVNAYSNDVQGYIPSERILFEGGYEADDAGFYYATPGRFAHGVEDKIVDEVLRQLDLFFNPRDRLRLIIDRATGEVSIVNQWDEPIDFDAYTITSADGLLSGLWNSLENQEVAGWEETTNSSPARLTEFNPLGSTALASGASLSLGTPINHPAPPAFGVEVPDVELEFTYSAEGEEFVNGPVAFAGGPGRYNNLVLTIDPATGEASIHNDSLYFDAEIAAYTIESPSGRLQSGNGDWDSLDAQGVVGWEEADNSNAFRLTEFNPLTDLLMETDGVVYHLGTPVDVFGEGLSLDDFTFEFLLASGEILEGVVKFGLLPGGDLPGDYNGDGYVDAGDYNKWRATFGQIVAPGSGADGNGNGLIDAADYAFWRDKLGDALGSATQPVPEPGARALIAWGILFYAGAKRIQRHFSA